MQPTEWVQNLTCHDHERELRNPGHVPIKVKRKEKIVKGEEQVIEHGLCNARRGHHVLCFAFTIRRRRNSSEPGNVADEVVGIEG